MMIILIIANTQGPILQFLREDTMILVSHSLDSDLSTLQHPSFQAQSLARPLN